ncbi:MAG: hypothetical protein WC538_23005 [Thermoanaerobaculia bacterium]|jgi:hypothetical protein
MIIAILDDQTVCLHETITGVRRNHEAIDVETGSVRFYDDQSRYLQPVFWRPNRFLLGGFLLDQGEYSLEVAPIPSGVRPLRDALNQAVLLEPNELVGSLEELRARIESAPAV